MATVTIAQGTLKGGQAITDNGFQFFEFLGIPYAKPPVGELRFKSPQTAEPWQGIRDATTTDACTISCQVSFLTGEATGSEDCLYLNVNTPQLPVSGSKLKPVMVHIHGGGFIFGNGILKQENGVDYLIENDVVIVAINYRLGPLGFINLGIPQAAGNMGLKDQIKALQWVQNNIHIFGGDKDNVTIIGVSAGAASCEYLLLSPIAKGLFHKSILCSGSSLNYWAYSSSENAKTKGVNLAKELGYTGSDDNMDAVYKFLLEIPAHKITATSFEFTSASKTDYFVFVPSIERDFENGNAFLTESPYTLLKEGRFNQVPVIRGFCNKEGSMANAMKPIVIKEFIENKVFTNYINYNLNDDDLSKYNSEFSGAYINNGDERDEATEFFGDSLFVAGISLAGKLLCRTVPVYMYRFCYDGKLNMFKALFGLKMEGAAHGDDAGYLLRIAALSQIIPNDDDILTKNRLTKMYTNFAKTGNPNSTDLPVQWPVFTEESKKYLNIDKDVTIQADYEPKKMALFESLYEKYA